jgi:hypothetical protein
MQFWRWQFLVLGDEKESIHVLAAQPSITTKFFLKGTLPLS